MGSIFKPSTTVVQSPSSSSTSYDIPEYFKEIQERTLRTAENVFSQPYTAYQGQRIAQLDPSEIQAENIYKYCALEYNNVNSQRTLAWMYENGMGVLKDDKEAAKWFRLAAEQGDPEAQYNFGVMYHYGKGIVKDGKEAA